jgi:lysophospholipase L1-like esterase
LRPRARKLCLLVAAGTLVLACLEIGLRAWARCTHRERGLVADPRWGWRMVPGAVKSGFLWGGERPAQVNSHGWRDAETTWEKPAGVKRLVVLGDSFTFGVGVDAEQRYTEELERLRPGLEVLNLGMNAVGTDQELLYLEDHGLRYAPDLVVCAFFEGNDLADVSYQRNSYWPKPYFVLEQGELVLVPPRRTWDVRLRMCGYLGEALYRGVQASTEYRSVAPAWRGTDTLPLVTALVVRMDAAARRAGARFALFLIRSSLRPRAADPLAAALDAAGIAVIDSGARLEDPALQIPDDGHWNAAGHRAAAELLAAELAARGWL